MATPGVGRSRRGGTGARFAGRNNSGKRTPGNGDVVFRWSIKDVLNKDLYKNKVSKIPETFDSVENYLSAFTYPVLEELRADMCSCMEAFTKLPFIAIVSIDYEDPMSRKSGQDNVYRIMIGRTEAGPAGSREVYEPSIGDVFIFSHLRPTHISDLTRLGESYTLATVTKGGSEDEEMPPNTYVIVTSRRISVETYKNMMPPMRFPYGVYVMNITTYRRIWKAIDVDLAGRRNK